MKIKIIIVGVFFFIGCQQTFAKGGNEHFQDMLNIFPFENNGKFDALCNSSPYSVNQYLDKANWVDRRKDRPHFFCDSVYMKVRFENHRIWFHWGLSDPIYQMRSLAPHFERLYTNESLLKLPKEEQDRFWFLLVQEEHVRLQKLLQLSKQTFGCTNNNIKQIWALVHILYDIHLLGDHTTSYYYIILSEEDVRKDIVAQIKILGGGENEKEEADILNFLEREVPAAPKNPSAPSITAQRYLDALMDVNHGFGHFLMSCNGPNTNYRLMFEQAGLIIKPIYSKKKAA